MAVSKDINAIIGLLQHATQSRFDDVLKKAFEIPDAFDLFLPRVAQRIDEGIVVSEDNLVTLPLADKSHVLYPKVKDSVAKSDRTVRSMKRTTGSEITSSERPQDKPEQEL
jgi:hypothetical protein